MNLGNIVDLQRKFYFSGKTKPIEFRIANLKKLKNLIQMFEENILMALSKDLSKSNFEAYTTEIFMCYEEIDMAIENLEEWMEPIPAKTPLMGQPAKSYTLYEPMGVTLVISPWNYPFQLAMDPLIGAVAAGNLSLIHI